MSGFQQFVILAVAVLLTVCPFLELVAAISRAAKNRL